LTKATQLIRNTATEKKIRAKKSDLGIIYTKKALDMNDWKVNSFFTKVKGYKWVGWVGGTEKATKDRNISQKKRKERKQPGRRGKGRKKKGHLCESGRKGD